MKIVIFGLTISSSWGNGHATIWRGLCKALSRRGHGIFFFERDVPYYASHRDFSGIDGVNLFLYPDWESVSPIAKKQLADADLGIITSYCADGIAATDLLLSSRTEMRAFYDMDTPVTLEMLKSGKDTGYTGPDGLKYFDLVLSYTGGKSLLELKQMLGARLVYPLYGSVDPEAHLPVKASARYKSDLSYLGTYSEDRQDALNALFLKPSRRLPEKRFLIGGSLYPQDFPWNKNIFYMRHVPPPEHPAFYCSSRMTLNVTRRPMAETGYCPSGRLFEAAACGTPVLTDKWPGLEDFFHPGTEIITASTTEEALQAIQTPDAALRKIAVSAREKTLARHTADHRAQELEDTITDACGSLRLHKERFFSGEMTCGG